MSLKIIAQVLFLVLFIGAMTTLAYLTNRLGIEFALGGLTGIAIMQFGYWGKYGKFIDF